MHVQINERLFAQIEVFSQEHGRGVEYVIEEALTHFLETQTGEFPRVTIEHEDEAERDPDWLLNELARR